MHEDLYVRWLRILLKGLKLFSKQAYLKSLLFLFSTAPKSKKYDLPIDSKINKENIRLDKATIQVYSYKPNAKNLVLLVHGWGGSFNDFRHFMPELLNQNLSIIGFDAPAHGLSKGKHTNVLAFKEAVKSLLRTHENFESISIIGHSLGVVAVFLALSEMSGIKIKNFFAIAGPSDLRPPIKQFAATMRVSKKDQKLLFEEIKNTYYLDLYADSPIHSQRPKNIENIVFLHDVTDNIVPAEASIALANKWSLLLDDGLWIFNEQLGHYKILKDAALIQKVVKFIHKHST